MSIRNITLGPKIKTWKILCAQNLQIRFNFFLFSALYYALTDIELYTFLNDL